MAEVIKPGIPEPRHIERARKEFTGGPEGWSHRGLMLTEASTGVTFDEAVYNRAVDHEMNERYLKEHFKELRRHTDISVKVLADRVDEGFLKISQDLVALGREVSHLQGATTAAPRPLQAATTNSPHPLPATNLMGWIGTWSPWQVLVALAIVFGGPTVGTRVADRVLDVMMPTPTPTPHVVPAPHPALPRRLSDTAEVIPQPMPTP